jgi:ABC-type transporter Mla MlaB component
MHARGPAIVLAFGGSIARRDLPALYRDACRLLESSGAEVLCCDVRRASANAVTVEALARLALAARRRNRRIGLLGATGELRELIALMGLGDVLLS